MSAAADIAVDRAQLAADYRRIREASVDMCRGLEPAEFRLQPLDDVSPPWWNLGHTSWFFARNVLLPFGGRRQPEDDAYDCLLNSYYVSLGERLPRNKRGLITRPTTEEIYDYRASVDRRVVQLIETIPENRLVATAEVLRIGVQHEQQHQELFYTEIKCILAQNPPSLRRRYTAEGRTEQGSVPRKANWLAIDGGLLDFGNLEGGWCWDNELPVHKQYLEPFAIADRLVTNAEYLQFIDDGGYCNPLLWLDNGWQQCASQGWSSPLYWERIDGEWQVWTLCGMQPLRPDDPVCHVSFYEADAFARWRSETYVDDRGVRLPTEREWEHAIRRIGFQPVLDDVFLDSGLLHPRAADTDFCGVVWQWTASYYEAYPGYRPFPGVLAEYNGKFMDNQRVLRGGSCATPRDHFRISYRNFWPAGTRFQFTGIRLARDA